MSQKLPNIKTDFAGWYQEVVYTAELADHSPVRGAIVIRPYGWALWENIRDILDKKIKATGHQNASFPLLIPKSFLEREAEHVEGFSPELAVVTIAGGKELEEPLVVRPTSETIIHYMFARWLKSWRDLPIKINQWANVVRWEMRTRPFLRTSEFHWQEGHTAHETEAEARQEALTMLAEYVDLIENYLAIAVVPGVKSESEKFAGADQTFTMECLMQDGKALQMGTSHCISQNFAKSFEMMFQDRNGAQAYPYLTSWGMTTRLIGAVIMAHGDQKGLILPPRVAPYQVVIIPILRGSEAEQKEVLNACNQLAACLKKSIRVIVDGDERTTAGAKFYHWELRGVPMRIEIGPRDVQNKSAVLVERLDGNKEIVTWDNLQAHVSTMLENLQKTLFERTYTRQQEQWKKVEFLQDFAHALETEGGFYQTGWCGSRDCEALLKKHSATIRCLYQSVTRPAVDENKFQLCFACKQASISDVLVARAY